MPTDSASTASDQDNFLVPIILVTLPVVQNAGIKIIRGQSEKTEGKKVPYSGEGSLVEDGEVCPFLGVASCEDKEQSHSRIQRSSFNEAPDGVTRQT